MKRPRRVLIASRLFPPEVSAGAFRLGALARAAAGGGASVRVVTTKPPAHAPKMSDPEGVDVRRWPVLRDRGGNVRGYVQYASYDAPLLLRLLFAKYDIAVAESPPTTGLVVALVSWLKRRPFVYYAADVWTDGVISMGAPRPVVTLMRLMERAVLARAQRLISVSDEVTERLAALGADERRIVTVGNGIDTEIFSPNARVKDDVGRYFIYTGTMSEWQQPEIFIRAFARIAPDHPDVRLKFFGQGAVEQELRRLAGELLPGRVDFGGVVGPTESASWIRGAIAALVSIVPGIGYDFARPTKTYAAAACGTPVIFAGTGAGAEVVRSGDLGEVADFEENAVSAAMHRALVNAERRLADEERARRARWASENVSLSAVGARVASVVAEL